VAWGGAIALMLALGAARPAAAEDWPMFLLNPSHVAVSQETLAPPMALSWRFETAYYKNNPVQPIIAGKTAYLASGSVLYALDSETGEQKWRYPAEGSIGTPNTTTIKASPVVAGGTVFVGAMDGVLYAIDNTTGVLKWQFATGGGIRFSPIVVGDVIYFGSDDYKVYGLDVNTGKQSMEPLKTGNNIIGSPAYADNLLYFASADLNFYAVNASTGRTKFSVRTTNANLYSSPVVTDRYIYTTGGNNLYCLRRNGDVRWIYQAHNPITDTPLVTDDGIFFGDRGGRLYAVDINGKPIWQITDNAARAARFNTAAKASTSDPYLLLAGDVYSSPVMSGSNIFVGTNRGFLYAVDSKTGKINWEYGIFSTLAAGTYPNIYGPAAISDGSLYVMNDDGALHCFRPNALDADKPIISNEVPVRATQMNGTPPILFGAIVSDEGSGIQASTIELKLDDNPVEFTYQPNTGWIFYKTPVTQPVQPLESGRHTVSLKVSDWKGNTSTSTWSFMVDNSLGTSVILQPAGVTATSMIGQGN
jgi:outer membrane protein assembly factor BamB